MSNLTERSGKKPKASPVPSEDDRRKAIARREFERMFHKIKALMPYDSWECAFLCGFQAGRDDATADWAHHMHGMARAIKGLKPLNALPALPEFPDSFRTAIPSGQHTMNAAPNTQEPER